MQTPTTKLTMTNFKSLLITSLKVRFVNSGSLRLGTSIALFLVLVTTTLRIGSSSSGSDSNGKLDKSHRPLAVLTIPGTNSIKINADRVISGATVLSGASIETPSYVGGKLKLGLLGAMDIAPNTILTLEFNQNDSVKVILTQGCVILNARKNITGEIDSPQGVLRKADLKTGSTLNVCFPEVAPAEVKLHDPELDSGLFDLGKTAAMAIIEPRKGAGIDFAAPGRGSNPGPSTP
jgi:hypothetical protein